MGKVCDGLKREREVLKIWFMLLLIYIISKIDYLTYIPHHS